MSLMHSARFYAQTLANHNLALSSRAGPYEGSLGTARSFGNSLRFDPTGMGPQQWNGGSGNFGGLDYAGIITGWLGNPPHVNFLMSPYNFYVGFGSHLGGRNVVVHYLLISGVSSS